MTERPPSDRPESSGIEIGMRPFERSLPMALMRAREASMRMFRPMLGQHGLTEQHIRTLYQPWQQVIGEPDIEELLA